MDKIKEFWSKYKLYIFAAIAFVLFEWALISLINFNHSKNTEGKEEKIKELGKENVQLLKEKKLAIDSLEYFHLQALIQNSKDTIYISRINHLKTKNHEALESISNLSTDSSLFLYSQLSEEYILTGFNN